MSKIYCGRYSCQYCFGEVCGKETVKINSNGCQSFRDIGGWKDPNVSSTDPWENYDKQPTPNEPLEEYKQRARILLREDKISKNDVNQDT